jgi:hypothetical protein
MFKLWQEMQGMAGIFLLFQKVNLPFMFMKCDYACGGYYPNLFGGNHFC